MTGSPVSMGILVRRFALKSGSPTNGFHTRLHDKVSNTSNAASPTRILNRDLEVAGSIPVGCTLHAPVAQWQSAW
jgi:hypothetical protein